MSTEKSYQGRAWLIIIGVIGFVIVALIFSKDNSSNSPSPSPVSSDSYSGSDSKWYIGGTLHRAKISDWKISTEKNKLATCGDFIAQKDKSGDLNSIKSKALDLVRCIDEAVDGHSNSDEEEVAQIAAMCTILLGF